ncbi:hypothetical protein CEQ90_18665 [Lewinellaceae bacterium SD302]|nr:hypothetical protein CEQ90_18665 [Lewinellaceae bacterium SD302]
MSFQNRSRGPNPQDISSFGPSAVPDLRLAADDYGYLQSRGYGHKSTTKIVGDRYGLNTRQRTALQRIGAGKQEIDLRAGKAVRPNGLTGRSIAIDGFNLLISLESALSGGFIFKCRDGAYRDMASISGSYKRVKQTTSSIEMVADYLLSASPATISWYLDAPISNSGRLATLIREIGEQKGVSWSVELVADPDRTIISLPQIIAISSDSWVMDGSAAWFNLMEAILADIEAVRVVEV